jgi:hypothetical protein
MLLIVCFIKVFFFSFRTFIYLLVGVGRAAAALYVVLLAAAAAALVSFKKIKSN